MAGCSQPKLLRHYENFVSDSSETALQLSVFVANPAGAESTNLLATLGDRGQVELIKAVTAKLPATTDAKDLLEALQAPQRQTGDPCAWASKDTATRRLVITFLGDLPRPADRVDKLDVELQLVPMRGKQGSDVWRATFVSWDRFEPMPPNIFDVGTASYSQSSKLTAGNSKEKDLAESAGSVTKALNLGAETERSGEESKSAC